MDLRFLLGLAEAGIEVIDLYPIFREAKEKGLEALYRYNDPRWDTAGIEIAAKEISHALARHGVAGDEEFTVRSITMKSPGGSIQTALTDSERDAYSGPDTVVHQVLASDGEKFQPAETSPVILAGDSYIDMYARPSANLAAHIAMNPVCVLRCSLLRREARRFQACLRVSQSASLKIERFS